MQDVKVTLPSGETVPAVTKDECEQKKQQGEDCDDSRFGLFLLTGSALKVGDKFDYVWYQDGKRRTGTAISMAHPMRPGPAVSTMPIQPILR